MDKFNAANERIKREYTEFLREADQKSEATVRGVEKAILRFEEYTGYCDFRRFNRDQAKRLSDLLCMSNLVHASKLKEHDDNDDFQGTTGRTA